TLFPYTTLFRSDLMRRVPSAHDRRVIYACLTERGIEVARQARSACADILRRAVLAPLGSDTSETLAQAMRILRDTNGAEGWRSTRAYGKQRTGHVLRGHDAAGMRKYASVASIP